VTGRAEAVETPIGYLPSRDSLNLDGVTLSEEAQTKLFDFDPAGWRAEFASIGEFLGEFGERTPQALKDEQRRITALLAG